MNVNNYFIYRVCNKGQNFFIKLEQPVVSSDNSDNCISFLLELQPVQRLRYLV